MEQEIKSEYRIRIEIENGIAKHFEEGTVNEAMRRSATLAFNKGRLSLVEFIKYKDNGGLIQYYNR